MPACYALMHHACAPDEQGATWPQAVQWLEEVEVTPGMRLPLTARHDTYGISFSRGTPGAHPTQHSGADDQNTEQCADANRHELPVALPTGVALQVPCPAALCSVLLGCSVLRSKALVGNLPSSA